MKIVEVKFENIEYNILIEKGLLKKAGEYIKHSLACDKALIVSDDNVYFIFGDSLKNILEKENITTSVFTFKAGEESKNIDTICKIYSSLAKNEIGRKDIIIALGGGVTGDMAGFAASTWMRGIDFVQVPTTLLACVDSSVGGKTGVNIKEGKNLVGAFHSPKLVLIDSSLLDSLSEREFKAGMAEVVKHALLFDKDMFESLEKNYSKENIFYSIDELLQRNCEIKTYVVKKDYKENYERMLLNFGHTIAHAIESATNYKKYLHGEAVSIGIVFALRYGLKLRITKEDTVLRAEKLLKNLGLPIEIPKNISLKETLKQDKKRESKNINFIFLNDIENPRISAVSIEDVIKALP